MDSSTIDRPRDLLSLASGDTSTAEYLEELKLCIDDPSIQGPSNIPPRSVQLAGLLLCEAIRLIRRGTRPEVAQASVELSRFLITSRGESLASVDPEAHRLVGAASVAIGAATPASSPGGEVMVLRSWEQKATSVLRCLHGAPEESLERGELLSRAGFDGQGSTHLLVDLESAGLTVSYRDEVNAVIVRARPKSHEPDVLALIDPPRA
jgi:hypothetical protein